MYNFSEFEKEGLHIEITEIVKQFVVIVDPLPKHFRVHVYKTGVNEYFAQPEKLFESPKKKSKKLPYHVLEKYLSIEGAITDAIRRALYYYDQAEYEDTEIIDNKWWKIPFIQPDLT